MNTPRFTRHNWLGALGAVLLTAIGFSAAPAQQAHADRASTRLPLGSMYNVVDQIGARDLWNEGYTGEGINVAVIDTGIAPVPALSDDTKVIALVDLSAEAGVPEATYYDNFGHGTHIAGIIAGHTPGTNPKLAKQHPEWFEGVAPGAGIVSVKVGDNTGAADITQVIAGVDWVVEHAADLKIRVLNLSYSSGSPLPYTSDPLTYSLERAWQAGIVVVVAAGNDGNDSGSLSSPAVDPYVIAVGAVEATSNEKFTVPSWASSGDGTRNPDVVAPGAHIDSLRVPYSRIDMEHPEGYVSSTLFRGSGSSQATAVVSGAAALLLDARPNLTNDQVKALLQKHTQRATPNSSLLSGAGVIQLDEIVDTRATRTAQTWPAALGDGSLEAARGGAHIVLNGVELTGETTVLGTPWVGTRWTGTRWTDGTWDGTRWTGGTWIGTRWTDASWTGTRWTGTRWTGTRWTDSVWDGTRWTGTRWTGTRWTLDSWTGTRWTGTRWTGTRWTDGTWDGTRWTSIAWAGTVWE